jgi:hypothetical protein
VDDFACKKDVIDACLASVHIPYFLDGKVNRHTQTSKQRERGGEWMGPGLFSCDRCVRAAVWARVGERGRVLRTFWGMRGWGGGGGGDVAGLRALGTP